MQLNDEYNLIMNKQNTGNYNNVLIFNERSINNCLILS